MTLLYVVVAWTQTAHPIQIQLCGAYRDETDAHAHVVEAQVRNPNLIFDVRICPFPEVLSE